MGKIKGAFLMPHPPIIVPFIGKDETDRAEMTIKAMREAAVRIAGLSARTIIVVTPHGNVFDDYVFMMNERKLKGHFHKFGDYTYERYFTNDVDLLGSIIEICRQNDFPAGILNPGLRTQFNITGSIDHGAMVPLYFISQETEDFKVLIISISNLDGKNHQRFGEYVKEAVGLSDNDAVVIASGDLSHYLSDESPYGYRKEGPEFDRQLVELLKNNDLKGVLRLPEHLCERAGQCGLKSLEILSGILDEGSLDIEVMSYEGPFGIGYSVVDFFGKKEKSPYVKLAFDSIKHYFDTYSRIKDFGGLPEEMLRNRAGVFVSIKKKGKLRGCIGTLEPTRDNIAAEISENALSAALRDPRFDPLEKSELDEIDISVDVLKEPEKISDMSLLDPKKYGVIVSKGFKRGVLLPDLEGVDSVRHQLSIALAKAGISEDDDYQTERFEVIRYR